MRNLIPVPWDHDLSPWQMPNRLTHQVSAQRSTLEHFYYLRKKPYTHYQSSTSFPPSQPLTATDLLSISTDVPIQDVSYKWNHMLCGLLWLPSFTQHTVFKVRVVLLHVLVLHFFIWMNNIWLHEHTAFYLSIHQLIVIRVGSGLWLLLIILLSIFLYVCISLGHISTCRFASSSSDSEFNLWRNCHTTFYKGYTILHSQQ